jgi:multidrug resistance efflux pump
MDPPRLRVTGRIVSMSSAKVGARVAGRIVTWGRSDDGGPLDVGSRVKSGATLFTVDRAPFEARLAAQKAALALAEAQLADLLAGTRPERIAVLEAAIAEIDARLSDRKRQEDRYRRLVQEDKTLPARRLEEIQEQIASAEAEKQAAAARLAEAKAGATPTEVAVARARVAEASKHVGVLELELADTTVVAPFDGVVTRKHRGLGDHVNVTPFVEVLDLLNDRDLEVEVRLPEARFAEVRPGTSTITLESALLAGPVSVVIARIVASIDPAEGVFVARAPLPAEKAGRLVPGAFVAGFLPQKDAKPRVLVPKGALVFDADGTFAFVAKEGRMQRVPVSPGERLSDGIVVNDGIGIDAIVLVGPRHLLVDGAPAPGETSKR